MPTTIKNIQDALALIANPNEDTSALQFAPEFAQLKIVVEGERYQSSVPTELARALWQYQEALYKAVAFALYGVEDIRRLTAQQRQDFELNFKVEEGSSLLLAPLEKFLDKLSDELKNMDSADKRKLLIAVGLILSGCWGMSKLSEFLQNRDNQQAAVAIASVNASQQESREATLRAVISALEGNSKVAAFQRAAEEGGQAVVKGADDARRINVPGKTYTRDEIEDMTQRAPREDATSNAVTQAYKVVGLNAKSPEILRLTLLDPATAEELQARLAMEDVDADAINAIWQAARDGQSIELELSKTYRRNTLVQAVVLGVKPKAKAKLEMPALTAQNRDQ